MEWEHANGQLWRDRTRHGDPGSGPRSREPIACARRCVVYLFGSWAPGRRHDASDIDVANEAAEPLAPGLLARLRQALEESTIPYRVDVVDLADEDPAFHEWVRREGVVWTGSANG